MLKIIGIVLIVLLAICIVCLVYSCCVISGRTSRQEELERIYKANGLSDLENVTLEQLLKMYEEDKVSFIINDGEVVDYETEK